MAMMAMIALMIFCQFCCAFYLIQKPKIMDKKGGEANESKNHYGTPVNKKLICVPSFHLRKLKLSFTSVKRTLVVSNNQNYDVD